MNVTNYYYKNPFRLKHTLHTLATKTGLLHLLLLYIITLRTNGKRYIGQINAHPFLIMMKQRQSLFFYFIPIYKSADPNGVLYDKFVVVVAVDQTPLILARASWLIFIRRLIGFWRAVAAKVRHRRF